MHVTKQELADYVGLTTRRITELLSAGLLPPATSRGEYDLKRSIRAYIAFLKRPPKAHADEKARLTKIRADLMEIRLRKEAGELIEVSKVKKRAFERGRLIRDNMLNVADRVCGLVAAESDQVKCHTIISREITDTLQSIIEQGQRGRAKEARA